MKQKVIAVAGPTASGKTALAIELAHKYNGEIISADSRLVYKGFNIAAAKPTKEEMQGIPHHLIDIVEPEADYTAGDYAKDAKKAIEDILSRKKTPIIAGGTGLYFRVLLENYDLTQVETDYKLRAELENKTKEELIDELKNKDIEAYKTLTQSTSKRRIIRIIELITTMNKPLSEIEKTKEAEYEVEWIMPEIVSRDWLYERINRRVDNMIEQGVIDETKHLLKKHGRIRNFTDTIGYKELLSYLDGECSLDEAINKLKQHTRNYAKRQLTWFRRNPNLKITI